MMKQGNSDDQNNPQDQRAKQNHPPQKCPRCESLNTKFCYYNNYSLSQPRYFCKTCRRYWTQGGTLRNVPVGGGCRKGKRTRTPQSTSAPSGQGHLIIPANPQTRCQSSPAAQSGGAAPPSSGGANLGMIDINSNTRPGQSLSEKDSHSLAGSYATLPPYSGIGGGGGGGAGGFLSPLTYPQGLITNQGFNQPLGGDLVGGSSNLGLLQGYINYVNLNPSFSTMAQIRPEAQVREQDHEQFYQIENLGQKISGSSMINTPVLFPSINRSDPSASSGSHYAEYQQAESSWAYDRGFFNTMAMNDHDNSSASNTSGNSGNNINVGDPQTLNPSQWPDHHRHLPGFSPPS